MKTTLHALTRMNQRGITRSIIEAVLNYGRLEQDRAVLSRRDAAALVKELERDLRTIKKILDKGGVVVVTENNSIITTYNYKQ